MKTSTAAVVLAAFTAGIIATASAQEPATTPAKPAPPAAGAKKPEKWIGLRCGPMMPMIRPHLKRQLTGMPDDAGLMVYNVSPESPAVVAGVEQFDVLLRADGQPLSKPEQLQEMLSKRNFGTSIRLDIIHEGLPKTVFALVLERPEGEAGGGGFGGGFGRGPGGRGPGGPGGPGGMFSNSALSYTGPDGKQQKVSGEQMMDFWRKMREDENFRTAVSKQGFTIHIKPPPPPPAEGTTPPAP